MRFDIGLSGSDDRGNGAFNQNVLHAEAVGTVTTNDQGGLNIDAVGSFPVAVNRTGRATTNFRLRLSAPSTDDGADTVQPRITAQYPSACLYTFGQDGFAAGASRPSGLTPISDPEADCVGLLAADGEEGNDKSIDSFPLNDNPSITFSEPVDPASLNDNILMTDGDGAPVDVRLRAEGASVVVDPAGPLQADTEYTITVGNGITDLAGNGLQGSYPDVAFTTEPMVDEPVPQNAPYLSVLLPGLPCALKDGDFMTGGDTAGRCTGDDPLPEDLAVPPAPGQAGIPGAETIYYRASPEIEYPVFEHPANVAVQAEFTKPVQVDTIVAADGCLINGGGENANSVPGATVAVQIMDGNGQCTGVADGEFLLRAPDSQVTRGFSFRPSNGFEQGRRYWLVMCGSEDENAGAGPSDCTNGATILGQDGYELNTNPIAGGTGTSASQNSQCYFNNACITLGGSPAFGTVNNRGVGGPDLIMPFDAAAPTDDFYAVTQAAPVTDTNGNGFLDRQPQEGEDENLAVLSIYDEETFDPSLGAERDQPANSVILQDAIAGLTSAGVGLPLGDGPAYLSGALPTVIREAVNDCDAALDVTQENGTPDDPSDDTPLVSGAPDTCIPVDVLPGGFTSITSSAALGILSTGRVLLRYPYARDDAGNSLGKPQRGYIVPECEGTFRTRSNPADPESTEIVEEPYRYAPCFVADFRLTVNGPALAADPSELPTNPPEFARGIGQQDINVKVFGPVAFQENGRLAISTRNANTFAVTAAVPIFGYLPGQKVTYAGKQRLQLVTPPVHGGPLQAFDVP